MTMQHCERCNGQTIPRYNEIICLSCGHDQKRKLTVTDSAILEKELDAPPPKPKYQRNGREIKS